MMNFRTVTAAIITLLGSSAASRYKVVGYQSQGQAASEIKNNNRTVQVYYGSGDFSKSSGRKTGSKQHGMTFAIGLSVSAPSRVNLSVINNIASTTGQVTAAMTAMQDAAYVADLLFDELVEIIYQLLMDARNTDLGLAIGKMSDPWVDSVKKESPEPQGELVVLSGVMTYTCNTVETVTGATGVAIVVDGITTVVDVIGDNVEKVGVTV